MSEKSAYTRKSVPQSIADILAKEILENHKAGIALPTVQALATRFKVSIATIRNAILILSKDGLVECIHGSGTYVRERNSLKHIAVVTQIDAANFHKVYFFSRVIQSVDELLERKGVQVHCYTGYAQPGKAAPAKMNLDFLRAIEKKNITAAVCVGANVESRLLSLLHKHHVPSVGMPGSDFDILPNYVAMIREGLKVLASQGKRRVALFANKLGKDALTSIFQEEARGLGLETRSEWIQTNLIAHQNAEGSAALKSLWRGFGVKPDCLICLDDILFADVFMGLVEMGIQVPSQLAIVAHSNRGSNLQMPIPVTYLETDPYIYARMLVDACLQLLRGEKLAETAPMLPFEVIESHHARDALVS